MFVSHTKTRQDTRQHVTHYGSANQEFAASFRRNEQKRVIIKGVSYPLSPIPLPLLLPAYPLPLLAPATQDTIVLKTFFFLEFFDVV